MAGIITHLAIANRIINALPEGTVKNKGLFYEGAIAPDLIRMREGVVRAHKKHSHLRDNIADTEFSKSDSIEIFHNRVTKFIDDNITKDNSLVDLYKGYVVHVLSDEMFLLTIRPDFVVEMDKLGIGPTDILFRDRIFQDLDCHDFRILKDDSAIKDILSLLKNIKTHSVDGYISDKEIFRGINWVVEKYINQKIQVTEPIYIPYEKILTYIDETAENLISRLSDGEVFPKIF